ncbi:MAG: hypothetical protein J6R33_01985, partial [Clostridia bacterium]|nr:hypothetical protein [Clostridia bacterium]
TYKCGIYSTITDRMYEIPNYISPNLEEYLTARFADILSSKQNPYELCCQDMSIYKQYSDMEHY